MAAQVCRSCRARGRSGRRDPMHPARAVALACAAACALLLPAVAAAYTAVGDRLFPATVLLPQAAPAMRVYVTPSTRPVLGRQPHQFDRLLSRRLLTERLGIGIQNGYNWIGRTDASTLVGWQNLSGLCQIRGDPGSAARVPVLHRHRRTNSAAPARVGSARRATARHCCRQRSLPKALAICRSIISARSRSRALPPISSRPGAPRPDNFLGGLALEYSIPYLQSKVRAFDLPDLVRGLTPLVETLVVTPTRNRGGATTAVIVAPGMAYIGEGWQFAIEARVPANRAAGSGAGVLAQFNLQLDYFFPDSIGKPLFSWR